MSIVPETGRDGEWAHKSLFISRLREIRVETGASPVQVERSSTAPPASRKPSAFWPAPTAARLQLQCQPRRDRLSSWTFLWRPDAVAPRRLRDSAAARDRTSGSLRGFRWLRAAPFGELRRGAARGDRFPARSARGN